MKRVIVYALGMAMVALTGCTNQVSSSISVSEFITNEAKVDKTVALYVTDEFKTHSEKHNDVMDFKTWDMQIGPMATDAFIFAYQSRFENVLVKNGMPDFSVIEDNVDYVITPEFTYFKAGAPLLVKFENYWVDLGIKSTIQDRQGNTLATVDLRQKGVKQGSVGFESAGHAAYPVACREAVKPIVKQTLQKTIELAAK